MQAPQSTPSAITESSNEEDHWATAMTELETGQRRPGLWGKAFAESEGDETKAKVAYLKSRVQQLTEATQALFSEMENQRMEAAEADRIEEAKFHLAAETLRIKVDRIKLKKIHSLAESHLSNPRMTIDEKEQLLRLAGGSFTWLYRDDRCSATFLGEEKQFSTGKEFSSWFISDVVPFLLSIEVEK